MMKKLLCTLLVILLTLALCACTSDHPNKVSSDQMLTQAVLSQEEQDILSLLGTSDAVVLDYSVDESIRTVRLERYELSASGNWTPLGGGSFICSTDSGRIALSMTPDRNEIRLAIQDKHGTSAVRSCYPTSDFTGMSIANSYVSDEIAIVPDQEIPLAIQILTTQTETRSYAIDSFFHPEEIAQHGYEHVYAITATFSENSFS